MPHVKSYSNHKRTHKSTEQSQEDSQVDSLADSVLIVGGNHDGNLPAIPQVDLPHHLLHHHVVHLCRRIIGGVDWVLVTHGHSSLPLLDKHSATVMITECCF